MPHDPRNSEGALPTTLAKTLSGRHIEFIALGGAIGAGLFIGSGRAIQLGGPSVLLAYILAGSVVYLMTRALGELTLNRPITASFISHIDACVGRWAAFITGWSYWVMWVLLGILEITAASILIRFWFPGFPQWLAFCIMIGALYLLNQTAVRLYGELEFWLALIKIVTIGVLIIGGTAMALMHSGAVGHQASFANLWRHGGWFPHGIAGFVATLTTALFAYGAAEMIGVVASEASDPSRSVPRAINAVILRILIFYVGSLAVIMAVTPWTTLSADRSPYVMVFEVLGLPGAAGLINFVVITAVISSCNGGIFATGRMLFSLAEQEDAPSYFVRLNHRRLPSRAITVSSSMMAIGGALNYVFPDEVFGYIMSVIAALLLWTWIMIVLAHIGFRRGQTPAQTAINQFRMPFYPWSNIVALASFGLIVVLMACDKSSRPTFYTAFAWFLFIATMFLIRRIRIRRAHRRVV